MNPRCLALTFLLCAVSLSAGTFDQKKLIPLLRFPSDSFQVGFSVTEKGVGLLGAVPEITPSVSEQITAAELRRKLQPDDPEPYSALGFLYLHSKKKEQSEEMFVEAIKLRRARLAQKESSEDLENLAICLQMTGKSDEAERLLRSQLQQTPSDHRLWAALGDVHASMAYATLTGSTVYSLNGIDAHHEVMHRPYSPEQLASMEKNFRAAVTAFDRAIEVSPRDLELYRRRILFRFHLGIARDLARTQGADDSYKRALRNFFDSSQPDARQIALLDYKNPEAISVQMFTQYFSSAMASGVDLSLAETLSAGVSPGTKEQLEKGVVQLQALTSTGKPEQQRSALVSLGFFQFLLDYNVAGEKSLRAAIALDPSHDLAWETLGAMMAMAGNRWDDLLQLSRERAKSNDSVRNRFIAAKAADRAEKPADAKRELQAALKLDPQHVNSQLGMVVVHLREGSPSGLKEAGHLIAELNEPRDLAPPQRADLMLVGGVYFALTQQPNAAKDWFEALIKFAPTDERGKAAMAAWQD